MPRSGLVCWRKEKRGDRGWMRIASSWARKFLHLIGWPPPARFLFGPPVVACQEVQQLTLLVVNQLELVRELVSRVGGLSLGPAWFTFLYF